MRIILALSLVVMQAGLIAAEPEPDSVTCDYARFEGSANISEPTELELELTGEIFLAPTGIFISAINSLTSEEIRIVFNRESRTMYLLYPDTLNGTFKKISDESLIWDILDSGVNQASPPDNAEVTSIELEPKTIHRKLCTGMRYETGNGGSVDIWLDEEGNPIRFLAQNDSNMVEFDISKFEHDKEIRKIVFEISDDFSITEASEDEDMNPFQL